MRTAFRSCLWRRILVWLLAGLMPLQALAAAMMAAKGPAHTHVAAASTRLVLDDLRRSPVRSFATHAAGPAGHVHDGREAERHRHAPGDPTVAVDGAEALQADDADATGLSPLLGVVGLVSAPPRWPADATAVRAAARPPWQPQTHHPARPERPPRTVA